MADPIAGTDHTVQPDNRTPEYAEVISYYKSVAASSSLADIQEVGMTDAGYPLHTVILDADGDFDPGISRTKNKTILLINNGIHRVNPMGSMPVSSWSTTG